MAEYITFNVSGTTLMVDKKFERKLEKIIAGFQKAKEIIGEVADEIYVLRKRDFRKAARRFAKFTLSSPSVVATTEFENLKHKLKTRTFINASSKLVRRNFKGVLAHEFAHIKQYKAGQAIPLPRFKKSLPAEAKRFAMIFLNELEEILADSLLPAKTRNKKNREIVKMLVEKDELAHPLFLLALKITTNLPVKEREILEEMIRKSAKSLKNVPFPFNPVERLYNKIFEQKEVKQSDIPLIENVLNLLIERLYGVKNACRFN
ncbi:MAG TPA: hypothetical protein ENF63_00590 [Candidatus Bathyarchaeota archaeon]|nr:hypothetical protein [Candidatus Bathyarchaeota archaeon]